MFKLVVVFMLLAVIASLFSGLFFLYRGQAGDRRCAQSLTWRISLSLAILALLVLGHFLGIAPGRLI